MNKLLFIVCAVLCTVFMSSCDKNENEIIPPTPEKVLEISGISSEDLNGWDKGVLVNEDIFICQSTDSLTNDIYGIIGSLSNSNNMNIIFSEGQISQIITESETFNFIYDDTGERVVIIKREGSIVELEAKAEARAAKMMSTRADNKGGWFNAVQDFLNKYADQLETSDSRFIRDFADDLRDLPYNLLEDGVTDLIAKLTGLGKLPYVKDILKWLQDNHREQSLFSGCTIGITSTSESTEPFTIKASVSGFNNLPELGDVFKSISAGIVGRYTGTQSDSWNLPTITYNEYKWGQTFTGDGTITGNISKMKLGWYTFRPYMSRGGVTIYGTPKFYYCPTLDETPKYKFSNIKCEYAGNDKFNVQFTCTLEPLKNNALEYQGIELTLKDGSKLVSFGSGRYTENVSKTISASNFSISGLKATLEIKAQYWYVPMYQSKTFYKDLESNNSIVYDDQPTITFTSAEITGIDSNVDGYDYKTHYAFTYNATGTYWIDHIQYTIVQGNWNNYWDPQTVDTDGSHRASGTASYSGSRDHSHESYYTIYLKNGSTKTSTNSLYFSGYPISSVSISGSRSATRSKAIGIERKEGGSTTNRCDQDK